MELTELDSLSSSEIDQKICDLEQKLKVSIIAHEKLEQQRLGMQKQILEIQLAKKTLEAELSQDRTNIKAMEINLRILKSKFWTVKHENR
uniref:Uncharacterized protein n=1 Tax=viral metagenome TaxID=1070528 RepID=A0A6M3JHD7_9ZZZZ